MTDYLVSELARGQGARASRPSRSDNTAGTAVPPGKTEPSRAFIASSTAWIRLKCQPSSMSSAVYLNPTSPAPRIHRPSEPVCPSLTRKPPAAIRKASVSASSSHASVSRKVMSRSTKRSNSRLPSGVPQCQSGSILSTAFFTALQFVDIVQIPRPSSLPLHLQQSG